MVELRRIEDKGLAGASTSGLLQFFASSSESGAVDATELPRPLHALRSEVTKTSASSRLCVNRNGHFGGAMCCTASTIFLAIGDQKDSFITQVHASVSTSIVF